jgi:hypothetical protein
MPAIVPVLYWIDGGDVIFRSPLDVLLADSCDHAVVAFEVDNISHAANGGWSVQALGVASVIRNGGDRQSRPGHGPPEHAETDTQLIRLTLDGVSGRESSTPVKRARHA